MPHPGRSGLAVQPVRNGNGIVALRSFSARELVCVVEGRLLTSAAVWRLWKTSPKAAANCYRFDEDRYLSPKGELGNFSNHSCRPNSAVFKERDKLVLRAIRAIEAGDEVTHDYSTLLATDDVWTMRCNCGERACRGKVGSVATISARQLGRYRRLGAIPSHILAVSGF